MKKLLILILLLILSCNVSASPRNTYFNGISPGTIWNDGYAIGMGFCLEQAVGRTRFLLNHNVNYWWNDRLWFTFHFPLVLFSSKKIVSNLSINLTDDALSSGLGDVELLANYVAYKRVCEDVRKQVILTAGVTFPSSLKCAATTLDNSAYAFTLAAYGDYNTDKHIVYGRILGNLPLQRGHFKRGDELYVGGAFGWKIQNLPLMSSASDGNNPSANNPQQLLKAAQEKFSLNVKPFGAYAIKWDYIHREADTCCEITNITDTNIQAFSPNCPFDCRCGGDYFLIGPSIIIAAPSFLIQIALQVPAYQKLSVSPNTFVPIPGQPLPPVIPQFLQCDFKYNYRITLSIEGHF